MAEQKSTATAGAAATGSSKPNIIDRPLSRGKNELSVSSFSYLFSELVQYCQQRSDIVPELESKLAAIGYNIGSRYLDLSVVRASGSISSTVRPKSLISMLQLIHGSIWRQLFGHPADGLERSTNSTEEYYIYDSAALTNKYLSIPKDLGGLNCASFIGGIINGLLDSADFTAEVTAHWTPNQTKTIYIIKFEKQIIKREQNSGQL